MMLEMTGNVQNTATILEHDQTTDAKKTRDVDLAQRIDDASATVSYIGKAVPGSATSAAVWSIKKVDTTSGTIITWASGSSNFNQVWDDRASLTYS